jgi:glycosyltransferase involved in cell wall biosynthesis
MISIIICSRRPADLQKVTADIEATIGVPYEVIAIDNSQGKYGICAAYNNGASRSQYPLLCFMHEDISFATNMWGKLVVDIMQDKTIGVLGVAGGNYLANNPAGWWEGGESHKYQNVIHVSASNTSHDYLNPDNVSLADVVTIDGLWICTRKEIWEKHRFDEQTFPEFHAYDMDYCLSVFPAYRVCVTLDIIIRHFSGGSLNASWVYNAAKVYEKWKNKLPATTVNPSLREKSSLELRATLAFAIIAIHNNVSPSLIKKYTLKSVSSLFSLGILERRNRALAKTLALALLKK